MQRPASLPVKRWQLAPKAPHELAVELGYNPILTQVLYNRGLHTRGQIHAFLDRQYLQADDPFLLPDMATAVERIFQAIDNDEQIVVYGDFDADGVTSTVLLTEALRGLGVPRAKIRPYIPDRVDEGYGLNTDALDELRSQYEANLVITVDCGIRSVKEVAHANDIGLDIIITDHHSLGRELPPALAVINPKREGCAYPEKMLAGVGIAYKLAQALYSQRPSGFEVESLLDLVAIGTVADVTPLLGENRILVSQGLVELNKLKRPGLQALAQVAGLKAGSLTAESIGFALAPRINAAGRIDHAYTAARLLVTQDPLQARGFADKLNALNVERQSMTRSLNEFAATQIDDIAEARMLLAVLKPQDARPISGVVGLVAGRLKEEYYRPAIVLEHGEEESHGSCRSIPELHITQVLDEVADLLERYGGHAMAAGLTIRNENLPAFQTRIHELVSDHLNGQTLIPTLPIDAEIELEEVDWALLELMQQLEPTGASNPTPIFMSRNVPVMSHRIVGRDQSHLQITFESGDNRLLKGIAFRQGAWGQRMPAVVDVAYTLSVNEWNGRRSIQLNVQDLRLPQ